MAQSFRKAWETATTSKEGDRRATLNPDTGRSEKKQQQIWNK